MDNKFEELNSLAFIQIRRGML